MVRGRAGWAPCWEGAHLLCAAMLLQRLSHAPPQPFQVFCCSVVFACFCPRLRSWRVARSKCRCALCSCDSSANRCANWPRRWYRTLTASHRDILPSRGCAHARRVTCGGGPLITRFRPRRVARGKCRRAFCPCECRANHSTEQTSAMVSCTLDCTRLTAHDVIGGQSCSGVNL